MNIINKNILLLMNQDINKSFFASRSFKTLKEIKISIADKMFLNINSKEYKIFYIFLKSQLFISYDDIEVNILVMEIFCLIFKESHNFSIHSNAIKCFLNYLNHEKIKEMILKQPIIKIFVQLLCIIFKPYNDVDIEKFKFVDLLKDQKELDKKKRASPKTIKSDIIEKTLIFIKSLFNSKTNSISNTSDLENREDKLLILNEFNIIFSNEYLNILTHENETNRKIYIDILYKYLIKYFVLSKFTINYNNIENSHKELINNIEEFFVNEIYDNNIEIRQ